MPNSSSSSVPSTRRAYRCLCGAAIFFRNSQCLSCGRTLAYEPESARMVALVSEHLPQGDAWLIEGDSSGMRFSRCSNYQNAANCNWLRPAGIASHHDRGLCISCSLNRMIPDQSMEENQQLWGRIELAKRRLVSQLLALKLPVRSKLPGVWQDERQGLAFDFLRDWPDQQVTTGHANGVITVNALEADDAERERIRAALHEPYRTLLGHLRHEVGHYYWDRLVLYTDWLTPYRQLFGDERADYGLALQKHYAQGARPDWRAHHVSEYASSHPWEDWAESWAHYLHLRDALDSAASFGLTADDVESRVQPFGRDALWDDSRPGSDAYLQLINDWLRLTSVLNELSDSMGQAPFYPFVFSRAVVAKLQLVHEVIHAGTSLGSSVGASLPR
jgi:hypothetical protein